MSFSPARRFYRAHGLGNDYLVVDGAGFGLPITAARVRRLCDRHRGIGSDGVLVAVAPTKGGDAAVRIFNPDGSEAEKSGNGARIFAAWCYTRAGHDGSKSLSIETLGGRVDASLGERRRDACVLSVSMGQASFFMRDLPMVHADGSAPASEETWIDRELELAGRKLRATCLSVGNPHAVLLGASCDEATLAALGPMAERHAQFPRRCNVQLCEVLDRRAVRALIWERGAGPTLASGSSACAVVAACACTGRLDLDADLEVRMPGGVLIVRVSADYALWQTGPVEAIGDGVIADDLWNQLSAEHEEQDSP